MDCDRRSLIAFVAAAMIAPTGCARAETRGMSVWRPFARRFVTHEGRVVDTGNGGISHSEGQGYGMVLAEAAGDRDAFDRLWRWTQATLARKDVRLFSWKYDPRAATPVADPNNATDGDILIAWALLRASKRWDDAACRQASAEIRAAIRQRMVWTVAGRTILLPGLVGFVETDATVVNPAYYVWPALDAFAKADGERAWTPLIRDGERLLDEARFGAHRLTADWVAIDPKGALQPAPNRPPRFGFDAVRVPLYLLQSGRGNLLKPYADFWRAYAMRDALPPAWIDLSTGETATFPLSQGAQSIVALTLKAQPGRYPADDPDYYSNVLAAMSLVA